MTQHFDFVALGWVEKYLREEMDTAKSHLHAYQREPDEMRHLREALRNVHSATGVLKLCALDPAALLTQEIERVIGQLIVGKIAGEARRLAMTELAASMEALPAYLANVRAKREVSAGAIANVINDLRHFGNRPALPDSLFFNPPVKPAAGISTGKQPAQEAKLKQFAARAMRVCAQHSKGALQKDRDALKQLFAVGKHATPLLGGTQMEAYFRCFMGLVEALAQPSTKSDEVIVDILKNTFAFLKSLALTGERAIEEAAPAPYIKKMLYYIAKAPAPTALQQSLRDAFDVHDVNDVGVASAGRLIQEDDLLEALNHTMSQLLDVMEFMTSQHRDISSANSVLVNTVVPKLRQVGLQLKAIGLNTHADTISQQYESLKSLSEKDDVAEQADLLEFGGALVAVKESLEHKLKHGLSAEGDSMGHDLDSAIMAQTFRCLNDMKGSINREFARQELTAFIATEGAEDVITVAQLRPVHRASTLVDNEAVQETVAAWESGEMPSRDELIALSKDLLDQIPENSYAEQAAADMEQVVSVLSLMEDKQRESQILGECIKFIRESIGLGGLINDPGMACFAEAIAALEQFMERRTEDPLGNADDHLDRAETRARLLPGHIQKRLANLPSADDVVALESGGEASAEIEDIELGGAVQEPADSPSDATPEDNETQQAPEGDVTDSDDTVLEEVDADTGGSSVSMDLDDTDTDVRDVIEAEPEAAVEPARLEEVKGGVPWREALELWVEESIERSADAPLENPDADIDEELVECFVEEARKYIRKLDDTAPQFADDLENEKYILDIRAVFHTMKGSARTIELHEFGEFMYDMEKIFNALRDGYIKPTAEIAELLVAVNKRLPAFIDLMTDRVPLYTADFNVINQIASAISEKRFDAATSKVAMGDASEDVAEDVVNDVVEDGVKEVVEDAAEEVVEDDVVEASTGSDSAAAQPSDDAESAGVEGAAAAVTAATLAATSATDAEQSGEAQPEPDASAQSADELDDIELQSDPYADQDGATELDPEDIPITEPPADEGDVFDEVLEEGDPLSPKLDGASEPELTLESEGADASAVEEAEFGVEEISFDDTLPDLSDLEDDISDFESSDLDEDDGDTLSVLGDDSEVEATADLEGLEDDPDSSDNSPSEPQIPELESSPAAESQERADLDSDTAGDVSLDSAALDDVAFDLEDEAVDAAAESDSLESLDTLPAYESTLDDNDDFSFTELSSLDIADNEEEISPMEELDDGVVTEESGDSGSSFNIETDDSLDTLSYDDGSDDDLSNVSQPDSASLEDSSAAAEAPKPTGDEGGEAPAQSEPDAASFQVVDIDVELLEIFLETLDDSIETVDTSAATLESDPEKSLQRLKNTLHTLKGGANSIGLRNYGALVHEFESKIEALEFSGTLREKSGQSELYAQLDLLNEASQHVKLHRTDWGVNRPSVDVQQSDEAPVGDDAEEMPVADRVDSIRVGTNRIDRLLDMGLEVSMSNVRARRALDLAHQDRVSVQSLARRVEEIVDKLSLQLDTEIQAKTEAVPEGFSFDPLEMDRLTEKQSLAAILREAAYDLHEEAKGLGEHVNTAMSEAVSSSRLIEGTQSDLRLLRLVAFSRLGPGFRRLVNQVSRQLGKDVDFDLTCDEGGLDVSVFEQVKTALEHMLRNAVDHGIEMPEERKARGKSESGKVSLIIYRQAAEFVIRLMDDGKGLAPETLRKKAVERGILKEDERISEKDALQLIFNSGLSTADKVTDISGRGVGMDVVQQSIAQIGGNVQVSSKAGFYTQFDIRVPASIMVNGALLAAIGEEEVAVPLTSLDGSDFRQRDEILSTLEAEDGRLTFRNEQYELRYLGSVRSAGITITADTMAEFLPVLFARHGRRRVAFFADSVTNAEELVIRSLGAQFTGVPGIAGGSLKPDGQPVLALDLNELIRQVDYADSQGESDIEETDNRIVVLCVDDSVMMRRTYEKRLASLHYDVVTAEDGEAALDYLAEATRPPDFIFTDLEMPNMNGFDFIANMRRLPVMAEVPTVVVSSRDGDKHRAEANKVGATDFMAKGSNSAEGMQAMIQRYLTSPTIAG